MAIFTTRRPIVIGAAGDGIFYETKAGDSSGADGPNQTSRQQATVPLEAWVAAAGLIAAGLGIGWWLLVKGPFRDKPFEAAAGVSLFALFYVLAQAIERFLEPFSAAADKALDPDSKDKGQAEHLRDQAFAKALNAPLGQSGEVTNATAAADAQSKVDQIAKTQRRTGRCRGLEV